MNEVHDSQNNETSLGLMTISEASAYLNLTESMLRSLVFKKQVPCLRIGKCLRFSKAALVEWLKEKGLTV